jgi:hypothetical protein
VHPRTRRLSDPEARWDGWRFLRGLFWGALLLGAFAMLRGFNGFRQHRPSLHWPTTTGVILQSETLYPLSRSHHQAARVTYSYEVDDHRYAGHRITLWDENGWDGDPRSFVAGHPAGAAVAVYYDPVHPENAVLIPGADEFGDWFGIGGGLVLLLAGPFGLIGTRRRHARAREDYEAIHARRRKSTPRVSRLPHGWLTFEPGCKRKLNCFPDEECLLQVLGHDGEKLQDWQPGDRVIDSAGRVHRLVFRPEKNWYDREATGETWSWEQLLDLATNDARLIGRDPKALRQRVEEAAEAERIPVLLQAVDELPAAPRLALFGLGLFLAVFALGVFYGAYRLFAWLHG